MTFPDFTRGHWNDVKGYKHAYATPEDEAATEAAAAASTKAQKDATAKFKLWDLYDAVKNAADDKAKAKAQKAYDKARVSYQKYLAK